MAESGEALRLENVSKRYGGARGVAALNDVSLVVAKGEFLSVMGPSGSGKSTLLNLIAGLDVASEGKVVVLARDLTTLSDNARSDLRLMHIGIVFQSFNLFPTFTARQNVAWPLGFLGCGWREAQLRAGEQLEQMGVDEAAADRLPAELSGGEQQRVAIARALITQPQLLLADEPTGNLDSTTGQATLDLLLRLNSQQRLTIILVTHNVLAATYGHRTVELRDGRIVREARADMNFHSRRVTGGPD
jgi:putative ABC transport system ATP-binding protein